MSRMVIILVAAVICSVLAFYYFEDLRLREIAEVFGLTQSRICQIHLEAIRAIKSLMQKHGVCWA
jgi:DNA-directed RNA polymerase specialized sigma subunit